MGNERPECSQRSTGTHGAIFEFCFAPDVPMERIGYLLLLLPAKCPYGTNLETISYQHGYESDHQIYTHLLRRWCSGLKPFENYYTSPATELE